MAHQSLDSSHALRTTRPLISAFTVTALAAAMLVVAGPTAFAAPTSVSFDYTGTSEVLVVPTGVASVQITAAGGKGGGTALDQVNAAEGGRGGFASGTFAVAEGDVLTVTVAGDGGGYTDGSAGQGSGGFGGGGSAPGGGGGGGASSVRNNDELLLIAGGGGGAAGRTLEDDRLTNCFGNPGRGGDAGVDGDPGADCGTDNFTLGGGGGGLAAGVGGAGGGGAPANSCFGVETGAAGANAVAGTGADAAPDAPNSGAGGGGFTGGGSGGEGAIGRNLFTSFSCLDIAEDFGYAGNGGGGGGTNYVDDVAANASVGVADRVDPHGLVTITYTIADATPPRLTVPADFTVPAAGPNGAVVTYAAAGEDAVDGAVVPQCTPASGSTFRVGRTVVTCTAEDAAGNRGTASFTVTVTPYAAELTVRVTGPTTAPSRSTVTYVVTVTNLGPSAANDVRTVLATSGVGTTTTDPATSTGSLRIRGTTLAGALWSERTIASGGTITYTVTGTVVAKRGQVVAIGAGTLSATPDPRLATNLAGVTTRVT